MGYFTLLITLLYEIFEKCTTFSIHSTGNIAVKKCLVLGEGDQVSLLNSAPESELELGIEFMQIIKFVSKVKQFLLNMHGYCH